MANATTELKIEGMTCSHCQRAVQQALASLPGVDEARVDLEHGRATVSGSVSHSTLIEAVEEEGYHATLLTTSTSNGN